MANLKYGAIPEPGPSVESLRQSVLSLKQAVEVLTGQRSPDNARAITIADIGDLSNIVKFGHLESTVSDYLLAANNLSDLISAATALTNLGVSSFVQTLLNDVSAAAARTTLGVPTLGTPQASTSGTSIDFTGIPAGTKQIVVSLVGVSTNGVTGIIVQLGDADGFETTGYNGNANILTTGVTTLNYSSGFLLNTANAANVFHGKFTLTLENASTFTWSESHQCGLSNTSALLVGAGTKALSAELTQVRVTTVNGTDAFDAGEINIAYL